jgi:hypothetical protein
MSHIWKALSVKARDIIERRQKAKIRNEGGSTTVRRGAKRRGKAIPCSWLPTGKAMV